METKFLFLRGISGLSNVKVLVNRQMIKHLLTLVLVLNLQVFIKAAPENSKPLSAETIISKKEAVYKKQPVAFLENKGQFMDMAGKPVPFVLFKAEAPGLDLYVTDYGLTFLFFQSEVEKVDRKKPEYGKGESESEETKFERIDMELFGSKILKENIIMEEPLAGDLNFFNPNCPEGIYGVKKYNKVTIKNVYPNIDWVLYNSSESGFKYDFVAHPGADLDAIHLLYKSRERIKLSASGDLQIPNFAGVFSEHAPLNYILESKERVAGKFLIVSQAKEDGCYHSMVKFKTEGNEFLNAGQTFVIDPQVTWATFLGGNAADGTFGLKTDLNGNVFLSGYMWSNNFPTMNAGTYYQGTHQYGSIFIIKFSNTGAMLWSTYYWASSSGMSPVPLACDNSGNIYVCATTESVTVPVQNSGGYFQGSLAGGYDLFILKFNNSGTRMWATYYGGTGYEFVNSVETDNTGNVFVCGKTDSQNFPVQNAGTYFQGTLNGTSSGFILKFNSSDTRLWATYFDNTEFIGMTCDPTNNNVFVTGVATGAISLLNPGNGAYFQSVMSGIKEAVLVKFSNAGTLLWSTYYGGNSFDTPYSIVADRNSNVFICGHTYSTNLPLQNNGTFMQSAPGPLFISKFGSNGACVWATYFGGTQWGDMQSYDNLDVDSCGNLFFAFETYAPNVPCMQPCEGGYCKTFKDTSSYSQTISSLNDIFLARFSNSGIYTWGTYIGGNGHEMRSPVNVDKQGNLYMSGEYNGAIVNAVNSTYLVVNPGGGAYLDQTHNGMDDSFIIKFSKMPLPPQNFSYPICPNTDTINPATSSGFLAGGTYSSNNGLSLNPATGQISTGSSTPGTYTVYYTATTSGNTCNCVPPATISAFTVVTIGTTNFLISASNTVCAGVTTILSASGALTYTWSNGLNTPSISVSPTATTIYTVDANVDDFCIVSKTVQVVVSKCSAVEKFVSEKTGLQVYPNPNNGNFNIESDRDIDIILLNEMGQLISKLRLNAANMYKARLSGLSKGIYFVYDATDKNNKKFKISVD